MRIPTIVLAAASAALVILLAACAGLTGSAPTGFTVAAATDSTVMLSWEAPAGDQADAYAVLFRAVGTAAYVPLVETSELQYEHDPAGLTGWYRLAAYFGADTYYAQDTLTTVPLGSGAVKLAELDASGNAGFGWDRTTGQALTYSMFEEPSAASVDLYVTDFRLEHAGPTYSLASPSYGPSEPSGNVPVAAWRTSWFAGPLYYEQAPLPSFDDQTYVDYLDIGEAGAQVACCTEDGHFCFIRASAPNLATGEVVLESWFQPVQGLRLIAR